MQVISPPQGIGYAAAVALAQQNFTVFAGVRGEKDAAALRALNLPTLEPVLLDVTDDAAVTAAVARVSAWLAKTGLPLVGLVNNAGIAQEMPIEATPLAL